MSFVLAAVLLFNCQAKADQEQLITKEQLPQEAQSFLNTYFSNVAVSYVKQETERSRKSYDVVLANGTVVEFDAQGVWEDVDGNRQAIPTAFIPAAILSEVSQRYPQQAIVKIEKTDRGRYEVEIISGIELIFGKDYKFISVDRD